VAVEGIVVGHLGLQRKRFSGSEAALAGGPKHYRYWRDGRRHLASWLQSIPDYLRDQPSPCAGCWRPRHRQFGAPDRSGPGRGRIQTTVLAAQVEYDMTRSGAGRHRRLADPRKTAIVEAEDLHLYVVNEPNATVTAFSYDAGTGQIGKELQTISTEPAGYSGPHSTAEIAVHPSSKFPNFSLR
jgi:Lactonase, 7-bladed beta-propeller